MHNNKTVVTTPSGITFVRSAPNRTEIIDNMKHAESPICDQEDQCMSAILPENLESSFNIHPTGRFVINFNSNQLWENKPEEMHKYSELFLSKAARHAGKIKEDVIAKNFAFFMDNDFEIEEWRTMSIEDAITPIGLSIGIICKHDPSITTIGLITETPYMGENLVLYYNNNLIGVSHISSHYIFNITGCALYDHRIYIN